jgi:hypothetical protein
MACSGRKRSNRMKKTILIFLFLISVIAVSAEYPMLWTDKDDYNPGETVLFSGMNFQPNTNIDIGIEAPDGNKEYITANSDSSGSFANVPWVIDGNMAMNGGYYACAWDGANEACTSFTDCVDCDLTVHEPECVGNEIKFSATYNTYECRKKLKIEVVDGTINMCTAVTGGKATYVECVAECPCAVTNPVVKVYWWKQWWWCSGEWEPLNPGGTAVSAIDCCLDCYADVTTDFDEDGDVDVDVDGNVLITGTFYKTADNTPCIGYHRLEVEVNPTYTNTNDGTTNTVTVVDGPFDSVNGWAADWLWENFCIYDSGGGQQSEFLMNTDEGAFEIQGEIEAVPELNMTSGISLVALLLAGYAVINIRKKK